MSATEHGRHGRMCERCGAFVGLSFETCPFCARSDSEAIAAELARVRDDAKRTAHDRATHQRALQGSAASCCDCDLLFVLDELERREAEAEKLRAILEDRDADGRVKASLAQENAKLRAALRLEWKPRERCLATLEIVYPEHGITIPKGALGTVRSITPARVLLIQWDAHTGKELATSPECVEPIVRRVEGAGFSVGATPADDTVNVRVNLPNGEKGLVLPLTRAEAERLEHAIGAALNHLGDGAPPKCQKGLCIEPATRIAHLYRGDQIVCEILACDKCGGPPFLPIDRETRAQPCGCEPARPRKAGIEP